MVDHAENKHEKEEEVVFEREKPKNKKRGNKNGNKNTKTDGKEIEGKSKEDPELSLKTLKETPHKSSKDNSEKSTPPPPPPPSESTMGPTQTDPSQQQPAAKKTKKWYDFLLTVWTAIFIDLVINVANIILILYFSGEYNVVQSFSVASTVIALIVLALCIFDRVNKRKRYLAQSHRLSIAMSIARHLLLFGIIGMIIAKIVYMMAGTIYNPINVTEDARVDLALPFGVRLAILLIEVGTVCADCMILCRVWKVPKKGKSQLLMTLACFFNFILGIVEIKLYHDGAMGHGKPIKILPVLYLYTDAFIICGSTMGICLTMIITEANRLSETIGKVTLFLDCYFSVVTFLSLISFANSIVLRSGDNNWKVSLAIPAIFGCCMILCIMIITFSRALRSRLPPALEVEELNLSSLTKDQKSAYAKLITFNAKSNPGVSGEAVILLMEAYSQTELEDMNCTILRVYRTPPTDQPEDGLYTASRTWETLDLQKTVFDDEETLISLDMPEPKPLSKNQRKKLAKKAAAEAAAGGTPFPLELSTEQDIKEKVKFHDELMATEALVLLTSIERYDLTATLTGCMGRFAQKCFGKNGLSELLCIRFGLLAFHWPFVRSTFYCSNSKHPVARLAAVMYAISSWNKKQHKLKRCTVLLDPTYKHAYSEQAIRFGGWFRIALPPSHIINLKPHKNKSITEYFKSIKYRNQDGAFKAAGGVTVEEKDFDKESCDTVMKLWHNIAEGRTSKGNTSVLAEPDSQFIHKIGSTANGQNNRSLLFLKVDDEVIASCVLFRIGDTITSDLQGLHHDKARPLKAYFVMMQEVITIALREGKSFVDFGPTTEKPKLDIGCQSVPLTGALRTSSPLLSIIAKCAADCVKV